MNRNYGGGYSSYGGNYSSYAFPKYSSAYGSNSFRSGSSSPALVRSSTPSYREPFLYNSIINCVVPEEKNSSYSSYLERRELKTIKTEENDTETKKTDRDYAIPGVITRDTTVKLPGGKAAVRMVTQKLKENPYISNIEKESEEMSEMQPRVCLVVQSGEKNEAAHETSP